MNMVVFGAGGWVGRAVLQNMPGRHKIRAVLRGPELWDKYKDVDGEWTGGEIIYGHIEDFDFVHKVTEGMDGIIHLTVYFPKEDNDDLPFLINLKGLWNVLESARRRGIRRIVHAGSCHAVHPKGVFSTSDVRRPDGTLYAVCKRLQEEMCRQFHEAHGSRIIVLRPDYIVDSRIGIGWAKEKLGPGGGRYRPGWVCRHDFSEACRLALEQDKTAFDILHIVGTPEAEKTCNVARSREVLGLVYRDELEKYR